MEKLFAYGTLLESGVQELVFNRRLDGRRDQLKDYQQFFATIDGVSYPSIRMSPNSLVEGRVYEIEQTDLSAADYYEGKEYRRIKVVLGSGVEAWVYITY